MFSGNPVNTFPPKLCANNIESAEMMSIEYHCLSRSMAYNRAQLYVVDRTWLEGVLTS